MVYVTHDQTEAMTLGDRVAVMRAGRLQQVDTPQELYEHPGEPVRRRVHRLAGDELHARQARGGQAAYPAGRHPADGPDAARAARRPGAREVILGIRPENFEDAALLSPEARANGITFRAAIDVVESMGSDVFAYFTLGGESVLSSAELDELARDSGRADTGVSGDQMVARLDPATRVKMGAEAELWADVRSIHVFDPSNGANLTLPQSSGDSATATVT